MEVARDGFVFKCGEMAVDSEYLDVCFGDVNVSLVRDGPGGEYWLGCKECSQSFHVQCFLKEFTQDTWEKLSKGWRPTSTIVYLKCL